MAILTQRYFSDVGARLQKTRKSQGSNDFRSAAFFRRVWGGSHLRADAFFAVII
jgi:hypothetical protein